MIRLTGDTEISNLEVVSWPHFDCVPERTRSVLPVMPAKFDWRDRNAVMPVRNQAQCGSCWAFAATAALEGAIAIKHDVHYIAGDQTNYISPQASFQAIFCYTVWMAILKDVRYRLKGNHSKQMVDCATGEYGKSPYPNNGCNGGLMESAFTYSS